MLPDPLHPAIVHFPIVLMVALPLIAIAGLVAIRRGIEPVRAWSVVVAFGIFLFAASWLAVYTGGQQEDVVEEVVPEATIHTHEEAGERFRILAGLGAAILGLGLLPGRIGAGGRVLGLLATGGLVFAGWQVGSSGGDLVYEYDAASAYGGASVAPSGEYRQEGEEDRVDEEAAAAPAPLGPVSPPPPPPGATS
ncbi:MAG TPA: hypothetical protein VKB18_10635 [Gemmatimonadota bacterium]|nr:hypothetical protein [Gemmatimonadota bacterium]